MAAELSGESILDRMVRAVEKVRERLLRATSILENAGVPYAVIGGNAVAAWVSTIDDGAVRNSPDVDIIVRRSDFPVAVRRSRVMDSSIVPATAWKPSSI